VTSGELVWGKPKSESGKRTISLDAMTVAALREHRKRQTEERLLLGSGWGGEDLVFAWPDGSLIHPARVTKQFERLSSKAGLPPIRLHDLRHGWASHAITAGVDASTVSGRLGHHSAAFTMATYVHAIKESEKQAAETMGAVLLGSG
jgi:integrase